MLDVRISDEPASVVKVLSALAEHIDELPCGPGLAESLARIMQDSSYRFVEADDGHGGPLTAAGVITFFAQPMAETHILAVEALWFRDDELTAQLPVWRVLAALAQRMEFGGICISARSTNAVKALRELAAGGALDGYPVTVDRLPLQKLGNPSAVRSAFSDDAIAGSVFVSSPAVVVHSRKVQVDLSGREYAGSAPLYRGEGRLTLLPHWDCVDLDALAAVHFAKGFYARPRALPAGSAAPFGGTIAEQLLHQGYVGQGAVSLSTSFEVAAAYANHAGHREEALVFTVDAARLSAHTRIFDASATLAAACPWIPREAWTPLRRVVTALWTDLPAAGQFLERCYEEAFERAPASAGSLPETAGVSVTDLARVRQVFEEFAGYARQRIGSVDDLHAGSQGGYTVETHRVNPMAYFEVFARIVEALRAARPDAEPGWDTTPMGYLAKTARDDECFAAGAVPGECIVAAHVIDRRGHPVRRLTPP